MEFKNLPPDWEVQGSEPPEELRKTKGWLAGYKPPASYFNWFWNKSYLCLKELQEKLTGLETSHNDDVNTINTNMKTYLPLKGGTMTGGIVTGVTEFIKRSVTNSMVVIFGGKSWETGAALELDGQDKNTGRFLLQAHNGTTNVNLIGNSDKTLKWDGKNIVRSINGILADNAGNATIGCFTAHTTNPITSTDDDTVAKWRELGGGAYFFSQLGCVLNQPNQWGFLINFDKSGEVFQLWKSQSSGDLYYRSGNSNGWGETWTKVAKDSTVVHNTGDEIIAGTKTFTYSIESKSNTVDVSTTPASEVEDNFFKCTDKNDVDIFLINGQRLNDATQARLRTIFADGGWAELRYVLTDSNSWHVELQNGSGKTLNLPADDNSRKIPTTAWVQSRLAEVKDDIPDDYYNNFSLNGKTFTLTRANGNKSSATLDVGVTSVNGETGDITMLTGTPVVAATSSDGVAYACTVDNVTALTVSFSVTIIPDTASTNIAPTLNLNGLGAVGIRQATSVNTSAVVTAANANWLQAGKPVTLKYNGTYWVTDFSRTNANDIYGTVPVTNGGTGATTADEALANLGIDGAYVSASFTNTSLTLTKANGNNTSLTMPFNSRATSIGKASTTVPAVVVTTYRSGNSWYRIWSDKWVEQGGFVSNTGSTGYTVTLHKAYANAQYTLAITGYSAGTYETTTATGDARTTTNFKYWCGTGLDGVYWYAAGLGA